MNTHTTKFAVDQEVYFLIDNKVVCKKIESLEVRSVRNDFTVYDSITYGFRTYLDQNETKFKDWLYKHESELFATKQDLLNSL